jgi:hypothetical protein
MKNPIYNLLIIEVGQELDVRLGNPYSMARGLKNYCTAFTFVGNINYPHNTDSIYVTHEG